MNSRERIDAILHFEEPDRVGLHGWVWSDTIEKWGLTSLSKWKLRRRMSEIYSFFPIHTPWRQPSDYYSPGYDEMIVEETDEWQIIRDQYGVKAKYWSTKQGVPHILEAPVKCLDDFKEKIEPFMDPDDPRRVTSNRFPYKKDLEEAIKNYQRDFYVALWLIGPFEICRHFVGGIPQLLTIMIRNPHFASYMFNSVAEYQARVCETHIDAGVDAFFMGEDLGYKNGPFLEKSNLKRLGRDSWRQQTP